MGAHNETGESMRHLLTDHPRHWRGFQYVYPVLSRRSEGLSIGVNLSIDKRCNFDCVYCQVDRAAPLPRKDVDLTQVRAELDWMLGWAASGELWSDPQFTDVPEAVRRLNDIAFSGDGEPTACARFDEAAALAAQLKNQHGLSSVKIAVLTNATLLHKPKVRAALDVLAANQGEVWAKLDAGTEQYHRLVDRSAVTLRRVLDNILIAGRTHELVIQSLFTKLHGEMIPATQFEEYLDRLEELVVAGCRIRLVQLYTTARQPAEEFASPLSDAELAHLEARLRERLPQTPCQTYGAVNAD
ncbi:MAG: radical SAM protein [Deltaproteobacteria bacterium]|nr:radical SAM protein [Deltaproteobacteria bacterium]